MLVSDLTTLKSVKGWVLGDLAGSSGNQMPSADDGALSRLISQASQQIITRTERGQLLLHTVTQRSSGHGRHQLMLRDYPVLSVASLSINSSPVFPRDPNAVSSAGFDFEPWDGTLPGRPQLVMLEGNWFHRGILNISVAYQAGYAVIGEAFAAPAAPYQVTPAQPYGRWVRDEGVSYANGTALVAIPSGVPTAGQYVPPSPTQLGNNAPFYQFAEADEGEALLVSYSFAPSDLDYACCKWVGEWYKYKTRIGQRSQSMPGGTGTNSWVIEDMPKDVDDTCRRYRRVVPI